MTELKNKVAVAIFEKVGEEQFIKDMLNTFDCYHICTLKEIYKHIKLPKRSTSGSAGYDFYSPIYFELKPGKTITIPTGIRCSIEDGFYLGILPRSSYGFKYKTTLDNTMGIIDSDYYYANNEGHIMIKITNHSKNHDVLSYVKNVVLNQKKEDGILTVNQNDRFCQGIFQKYYITHDDDTNSIRTGGFGSTGE